MRKRFGRAKLARLFLGATVGAAAFVAVAGPAGAATTASFSNGTLTVTGDNLDNVLTVSRNAAGNIFVNGGAVTVLGGSPTVANTSAIFVFGLGGNDTISFSEATGPLPNGVLVGGDGNDVITSGAGRDFLFGQAGNDTLLAKGGFDLLTGGADNDTLTGGDADDQVFGESGNDRMVWNPGDDTDLNEGGSGTDTTVVNGGNGDEMFTATPNGVRVRFDRVTPAPFSIDMGTTESLTLNANGGADSFSASGNLAALLRIIVDGGTGTDTLLGSNGADVLLGGSDADFVDGQQGNDFAVLGSGDDAFQWDPGDANDIIEGQDGIDTMVVNGSAGSEKFDVSANGSRVRVFRDLGNVTMDVNDTENVVLRARDGADNVVVNDLTGTDLIDVTTDLAVIPTTSTPDTQPDNVIVSATNDDDVAVVTGQGASLGVDRLNTRLTVAGGAAANDRLTINSRAGDDVIDASSVAAGSPALTLNGDVGDDVLVGGAGNDTIAGGDGNDVLVGGPGIDTIDGGAGSNTILDGESVTAGTEWLAAHARVRNGRTVLDLDGRSITLPEADLV